MNSSSRADKPDDAEEEMLAKDAFLRTLPSAMHPTQAVQIDALVYAADAVELAFGLLRQSAAQYRKEIVGSPPMVSVGMLLHAWAIVDNIHNVRQVLRGLKVDNEESRSFSEKYEVATLLRNKMDHLPTNAGNLANASNPVALFGSLSYVCVGDQHVVTDDNGVQSVNGVGVVLVSTGRVRPKTSMNVVNPAGEIIPYPVGLFQLQAFGEILKLDNAVEDLRKFIAAFNEGAEKSFVVQAEEIMTEQGLSFETIRAHGAAGLSVYLEISFSEPAKLTTKALNQSAHDEA